MEAAPPSYEKATLVNAWDLIATYIPSSDLCSVALRTLPWARLYVRSFTHTLHLPPAHAELYNGPHADWLREVLDRLPNLQSLVVRGLPFFDHAALIALRYRPDQHQKEPVIHSSRNGVAHSAVELPAPVPSISFQPPRQLNSSFPTFGLRLLDASRCTNTTATGLCEALKRLDQLLYLDLSYTYAARDRSVLITLKAYSGLQVLKLRGINLRDDDIGTLAPAIGTRVRSLDLRNNLLTDVTARLLLEDCFLRGTSHASHQTGPSAQPRTPPLVHYLGPEMLATYQGDNFEGYLRNAFTTHFVNRLVFEDAPEGGITHLYISDNRLSVEGISSLIRSGRLHVLDARIDNPAGSSSKRQPSDIPRPGAEKLTYLFSGSAADSIRYLRTSHEIVTKRASVPTPNCAELPDSSAVFELSADSETPRELMGDTPSMVVTPARRVIQPTPDEAAAFDKARRGSAVAPEAVSGVVETQKSILLPPVADADSSSLSPILSSMNGNFHGPPPSPILGPAIAELSANAPNTRQPSTGRPRTLSHVQSQREARFNYLRTRDGFHPGLVPHLKTLVLTDVPLQSEDITVSDRLVAFIRECAEECSLARKQAASDYTLPPGRRQATNALKDIARGFFALETVILEMAPAKSHAQNQGGQWRHASSASLTGDRDSQALWKESESDFSFFGETEEVTFPSLELPGKSMFMQAMAGKESYTASRVSDTMPAAKPPPFRSEKAMVDTIAQVSAFRKTKKQEYQNCLSRGYQDPEVEGYWPGVVQVVRTAGNADTFAEAEEALDYFGNSFSKGYLYK
ncbi:hypothetical protein MBLNU457_7551t2 [Dothideomycetes sp. NU457]